MHPTRLIIVTGVLLVGLLAGCDSTPPADHLPNVVLICIDTLRADRIGGSRDGTLIAPFLTQFSQEAVYFPQAESPCSWTRPAMASVLTGLPVYDHGVFYSVRGEDPAHPTSDVLPDALETLPEFLVAHGYSTFGVQTNENLRRNLGFAQGFKEEAYSFKHNAVATWVTDQALAKLKKPTQPFFLYAHYIDPHGPFLPPEEDLAPFPREPERNDTDRMLVTPELFMQKVFDIVDVSLGRKPAPTMPEYSAQGQEWLRRQYDGEVHYVDREVQRLVDRIHAAHPNTIIVIFADHGEEFWDHGSVWHSYTLYQEQLHVPLMIQAPDLAPRRVDQPVSTLGILKTLAAYLDLLENPAWQGQDLLQASLPQEPVVAVTLGPWTEKGVWLESVREGNDKLILDHSKNTHMRFDLGADPLEQTNVITDNPDKDARLFHALRERHETLWPAIQQRSTSEAIPLTEEMRDALEAIGYLQEQ